MSSDSSSNASDTELDLSNVRESRTKRWEGMEEERERWLKRGRFFTLNSSAIDSEVPVAHSLSLNLSLMKAPPTHLLSPIDHPHSPSNKITRADSPMWSQSTRPPLRSPTVRKRFFLSSSQTNQAKPSRESSTHLSPFLSLSLRNQISLSIKTAALKAVVAECKVGAKLVDIANKGDALIEE